MLIRRGGQVVSCHSRDVRKFRCGQFENESWEPEEPETRRSETKNQPDCRKALQGPPRLPNLVQNLVHDVKFAFQSHQNLEQHWKSRCRILPPSSEDNQQTASSSSPRRPAVSNSAATHEECVEQKYTAVKRCTRLLK